MVHITLPEGTIAHVRLGYSRTEYTKDGLPEKVAPPVPYIRTITFAAIFGPGYYMVGYFGPSAEPLVWMGPRYMSEGEHLVADWDGGIDTDLDGNVPSLRYERKV